MLKLEDYGEILSVKDVCKILDIGANIAYKLLAEGAINNFKIGSVRKIPKQCLCDYVERMTAHSLEVNIHKQIKEGENNDDKSQSKK